MNDSNYSPSLVSALKIARGMALQDKHNTFGVSHLVMAMFAENTGLKEILSSMQKDVGYIMEWFDTHREMYRSSGTSTEEVEPDEELSKVLVFQVVGIRNACCYLHFLSLVRIQRGKGIVVGQYVIFRNIQHLYLLTAKKD